MPLGTVHEPKDELSYFVTWRLADVASPLGLPRWFVVRHEQIAVPLRIATVSDTNVWAFVMQWRTIQ